MKEIAPLIVLLDRLTDAPDSPRSFDCEDSGVCYSVLIQTCIEDRNETGCSGHVAVESYDIGLFQVWRQW